MNIQQLADSQLFLKEDPLKPFRDAVAVQSRRHTQRRTGGKVVDIIGKARPNEGEAIKKYRAENERQITRAGVEKFISKAGRIVNQGISFGQIDNPRLAEYLENQPFYDTGNRYDFEGYLFEVILPLAFENPNLLAVSFPYNPNRPEDAPGASAANGGLKDREELKFDVILVQPSFVDNDSFAYVGGKRRIVGNSGKIVDVDFYFAADKDEWYTLEPSFVQNPKGTGKMLIYTVSRWYRWNLGVSPVNLLPGSVAETPDGKYRESFLRPYFALADECINAFSDNQAIRVRFAHPAVGMEQVDCQASGCEGGWIRNPGEKKQKCSTCHGSGKVATTGPYGTLVRPKATMANKELPRGPLMEFYHPDVAIMKESWVTWVELLKMAKQEIGLDLLDGSGVESGRAKDLRLEDLHDLLSRIGMSLGTCGAQLLQQMEALLNPVRADRRMPVAILPVSYKILEASELKENAEKSLFEDRFEARMEYYRHLYRGRPAQVRKYEIALTYAPSILLNEDEISKRLASGGLSSRDVVKRDYAVTVLSQLQRSEGLDILKVREEDAFSAIDAYLTNRGLLNEIVPLFDD